MCSKFSNCPVLIVYQVTIHNKRQNTLHLNECKQEHVWSWTYVHFQGFRGCCHWFNRQKMCWWTVPSFLVEGAYTRVLSVHSDKNLIELRPTGCWAILRENVYGHTVIWTFSLFLCEEFASLFCPSILDTPCISYLSVAECSDWSQYAYCVNKC